MGRETDDGRHEGYVVHVFADGTYGSGWGGGPLATTADDGTRLPEWQTRTGADIVGWRAQCDGPDDHEHQCWRGPLFVRVPHPPRGSRPEDTLASVTGHEIYLRADLDDLTENVSDQVMFDWEQHIARFRDVYAIEQAAAAAADAQRALTAAVRAARAAGTSWDAIGRAAGITRQSAHERWHKTTQQVPNRMTEMTEDHLAEWITRQSE